MPDGTKPGNSGIAADRLRSYIERWERLQVEIERLKEDQKDIMAEAKGAGFDVKIIRQVIKLRKMDASEREEQQSMLEIYMHALGMLADTPLGEAAINRLTGNKSGASDDAEDADATRKKRPAPSTDWNDGMADPQAPAPANGTPDTGNADQANASVTDAPQAPPEPTIEDARRMGAEAAAAGVPVTANPFPARDKRRGAWDSAWVVASGSDGMDLPDAWKPTRKPAKTKKDSPSRDPAGSSASEDAPNGDAADQGDDE